MKKKNILLIDSDKSEMQVILKALENVAVAFNCTWVRTADHALRFLHNYYPDMILIDDDMPRVNGINCLEEIKRLKSVQDVPVILYSSRLDSASKERVTALGAFVCQKNNDMGAVLEAKLKETFVN
jgi:PleD family two-component response regulator